MQAVYENHYLSDKDVANFARQSFGKLADQFTEEQNNNLIRFLARGMAKGDWEDLVSEVATGQHPDQARSLAVYLRSIPEHTQSEVTAEAGATVRHTRRFRLVQPPTEGGEHRPVYVNAAATKKVILETCRFF